MGDDSKIEWTDATWPIVQGCDYESPGCAHCYAPRQIWRQAHSPNAKVSLPVAGLVEMKGGNLVWTGKIACREDRLDWPRKWTRPRMIFVPSLGDLFHEDVPDDFLHQVFNVMEHFNHHTYQVLTKRSARMKQYINWRWGEGRIPSRHIWLGVSAEDQKWADIRIQDLLDTIAAVRFVSFEPLLGPIDLHHRLGYADPGNCEGGGWRRGIDWAIVGGESGPGARPMRPDWARSIRDECTAAGVAFFFKQWGEWLPFDHREASGEFYKGAAFRFGEMDFRKVGKRAAGRLLDGRTWDEFPGRAR
jgi:protein gp37